MTDLNFFSIYKTNRRYERKYIYIIAAAAGAIISVNLVWSTARILILNSQIKNYTEKYNSEEIQTKLKEANIVSDKINILNEYEKPLTEVIKAVNKNNLISEQLLIDISNAVPGDVSFTEWKMDNYDMTLKGLSHSRLAIAELEHNFKDIQQFKLVHVDKIKNGETVGDDYRFEMHMVLKEGE